MIYRRMYTMKKMHIYEYIKQFDKPLVSPTWGGEQAVHFLCLGHLDISMALGFELEQATPVLTAVKAGQMKNEEMFESMIKKHEFDHSIFENEVIY